MAYNPTPNLPHNLYSAGAVQFDTRQLANMLFQEQRMRRMQQERENAELDAGIRKEVGKVRAADVPLITEAYSDWKRATNELHDRRLQRDPKAFTAKQQERDRKYQDILGLIAASQEEKGNYGKLLDARRSNPDLFSDDFNSLSNLRLSTPINKLRKASVNGKEIDLTNDDNYIFRGQDFDFGKIEKEAAGVERETGFYQDKPLDNEGIQVQRTSFKFGNSPRQFKERYMAGLQERKAGRSAAFAWDSLPKDEWNRTVEEFKKIAPDKWKQMGVDPQDLTSSNPESKAENWATYRAMRYAIDNPVRADAPKPFTFESKRMKLQEAKERRMSTFQSNLRKDEIRLRDQLKNEGEAGQKATVDTWLQKAEQQAKDSGSKWKIVAGGKEITTHEIPLTASLAKAFEKLDIYGEKIQPNALGVDDEGNYYPIFFKKNLIPENPKTGEKARYEGFVKVDGKNAIDTDLTGKATPRNLLSPELATIMLSPKLASEELDAKPTDNRQKKGKPEAPKEPSQPKAAEFD